MDKIANPEISIIMPLHDSGTTVEESIQSILAQSFINWELIVWDDFSQDDGPQKVRKLAEEDARISIYGPEKKKNLGPSSARNSALKKSKGRYVAFLDADDIWNPEKLETQMNLAAKNPEAGMIWGPALYFSADGIGQNYKQPTGIAGSSLWPPSRLVEKFIGSFKGTPCPSGMLVKREVLEKIGGFDEELRRGEDIALCLKIATEYPVYYHEPILFRYRRHEKSSTWKSNLGGSRIKDDLIFIKWHVSYVASKPELKPYLGLAEHNYHAALHLAVQGKNWFESRLTIYDWLAKIPGPRFKRLGFFLLDLFLPLRISRKISAKLRRKS